MKKSLSILVVVFVLVTLLTVVSSVSAADKCRWAGGRCGSIPTFVQTLENTPVNSPTPYGTIRPGW